MATRTSLVLGLWLGIAAGCGGGGTASGEDAAARDGAAPGDAAADATGGRPDGGAGDGPGSDARWDGGAPGADWSRDIVTTELALDLTTLAATATITLAGSTTSGGASFEIGDLVLTGVHDEAGPLTSVIEAGPPRCVHVTIPPSTAPARVTFAYTFASHPSSDFNGWMAESGVSFMWPYFCGNLFPCKSSPADGTTFTATVTGVPGGQTAVYPTSIPGLTPSYAFGLAVGGYTYHEIGVTAAGTHVGVYALAGSTTWATGTAGMRDIFNWFETTLGAYTYGDHVASVEANWGPSGYGGMEHHPFWHVAADSMDSEETHAHEAAHGWYGNGVRMRCWEDFVLSEGTATYLAAQAITEARGTAAGDQVWADYSDWLDAAIATGDTIAYPSTCNVIDILRDPLWSGIPYYKGAYFYQAVASAIGVAALKGVLRQFYLANLGSAVTMQDLLDSIQGQTGFDPTALADAWLRSLGRP